MSLELKIPYCDVETIKKIKNILSNVKATDTKVGLEHTEIDHDELDEYTDIIKKEFAECPEILNAIKRIKFNKTDKVDLIVETKTGSGSYKMALLVSKKKVTTYDVFIYYYKRDVEFTDAASYFRWLFGFDPSKDVLGTLTEENMKGFLSYKLAEYAKDFGVNIELKDRNNNRISYDV